MQLFLTTFPYLLFTFSRTWKTNSLSPLEFPLQSIDITIYLICFSFCLVYQHLMTSNLNVIVKCNGCLIETLNSLKLLLLKKTEDKHNTILTDPILLSLSNSWNPTGFYSIWAKDLNFCLCNCHSRNSHLSYITIFSFFSANKLGLFVPNKKKSVDSDHPYSYFPPLLMTSLCSKTQECLHPLFQWSSPILPETIAIIYPTYSTIIALAMVT